MLPPELLQPGLVLVGDVDQPEQRLLQLAVPAVTRLVAGLDGRVSHVWNDQHTSHTVRHASSVRAH